MGKFNPRPGYGFSLIEVMIAMGLASLLALTVFSLKTISDKGNSASTIYIQADAFRKQITNQLQNVTAWRNTLAHNLTFDCLNGHTTCSAAASNGPPVPPSDPNYYSYTNMTTGNGPCVGNVCNGGFDVYDANGTSAVSLPYYPFTTLTAGFSSHGVACNQFSLTTPSANCPFRLILWWKAICDTTSVGNPCLSPAVNVLGFTILSAPATDKTHNVAFKPVNYSINLTLPGTL